MDLTYTIEDIAYISRWLLLLDEGGSDFGSHIRSGKTHTMKGCWC
jgi:hypothetical protein